MKAVAKELREDDAKRWTQKRLAGVFGVTRQCVDNLFNRDGTSNATSGTACNLPPDARVKIPPTEKPTIAKRVTSGESQEQVAADYGVSQQTVSTIHKSEEKKSAAVRKRKRDAKAIKGDVGIISGEYHPVRCLPHRCRPAVN